MSPKGKYPRRFQRLQSLKEQKSLRVQQENLEVQQLRQRAKTKIMIKPDGSIWVYDKGVWREVKEPYVR